MNIGEPIIDDKPIKPYNLLLTNKWMAIILRGKSHTKGFDINALGFAGYFLATKNSETEFLLKNGPDSLLRGVVSK